MPAQVIDLILTPIAGGIGAGIGMHFFARGRSDLALPRYTALLVGGAVAALLLGYKLFGGQG